MAALSCLLLPLAAPHRQRRAAANALAPRRCVGVRAAASDDLSGAFGRFVAEKGAALPPLRPSPFMPPHRCVEAQLEALQSCDYPDEGAGVRVAWEFAQRRSAQLYGKHGAPFVLREGATDPSVLEDRIPWPAAAENRHLVLGWVPRKTRLVAPDQTFERFAATLAATPYDKLLRAERFELAPPAFNADASECEVTARVLPAEPLDPAQPWLTFNFRLRCVEGGAYRGCWMTRHVEAPWLPGRNYQ